jgi:antitoxin (DNA-binding transcriptional repressor) of toxin-antitoxin stability system
MATTIELTEAQSRLAELVTLARQGEVVVLLDDGKPVARIVAQDVEALSSRIAGLHPGNFQARDDFDEPLPENFWIGDE